MHKTDPAEQSTNLPSVFWRFLGLAALGFVGLVLCREAWTTLRDVVDLQAIGVVTQAEVHQVREVVHKHSISYDILYTFTVPGRDGRFGHRDANLRWRTFLWSSVPRDVWLKAEKDRTIDVVYLPDDPLVNRTVAGESDMNGVVILAVAGAAMIVVSLWQLLKLMSRGAEAESHGKILAHCHFFPVRTFAGFALTAAFCGWATWKMIPIAMNEKGPAVFCHISFEGETAEMIRWATAGAGALMTLGYLGAMAAISLRTRQRLAFTTNGILLGQGHWATSSDFFSYREVSNVRFHPDRGLEFDGPRGHVSVGRADLAGADLEKLYVILHDSFADQPRCQIDWRD